MCSFLEIQNSQTSVYEVTCGLELKWSPCQSSGVLILFVYWRGGQTGLNLGEGASFILADGLKIEFFWHRQVEGANVLSILCTLCFCPCNRPHVSELCDPLYYLKHTFVYLCQNLPSKFCQWLEYHLYIDNMHQPLFLMLTELHPTATTYCKIGILSTGAYFRN